MTSPLLQLNGSSTFLPTTERPAAAAKTRVLGSGSLKATYLQCYFVTIATILGTGILGLPVTLSRSGIYPFLVSFLLGFLIQGVLIVLFVDLLQKAHAVQHERNDDRGENIPLTEFDEDSFSDTELDNELAESGNDGVDNTAMAMDEVPIDPSGPVLAGHIVLPREINVKLPNLHLLGELFLGWTMRHCFYLILLIQFIALLICYSLAGSQAYAQVIGIDFFYVIPAFCLVLTTAVVFALTWIQPLVSLLTFVKGSLIVATVGVTFFVGASVSRDINNDFREIAQPFLMGTVALGGVVNVMPMLYAKIAPVRTQVSGFRISILLGLATCALLNVLWCWAVLDIVPQLDTELCRNIAHDDEPVCLYNISLESASQHGEISTIPLTKIIQELYPHFAWVAFLVQLFIMISITVSYLTIGAAMHHTLKGWVESAFSEDRVSKYTSKITTSRCCSAASLCSTLISLIAFIAVFTVAMLNPKGFVQMLDKLASSVINLEAGLFMFVMLFTAFNSKHRALDIPLPLPRWAHLLNYLLPLYFLFAVFYDIFISIYNAVHNNSDDVPEWILHPISVINKTIYHFYGLNDTLLNQAPNETLVSQLTTVTLNTTSDIGT